jgi:hypothetical protein
MVLTREKNRKNSDIFRGVHGKLDKEKPCIGFIRSLNLAGIRPTTVQVTAVSEL